MPVKRNVTPRQAATNRRNAHRSTGPRTPEGKRHSRMNALRHGLCTKAFRDSIVELSEDPAEFDRLHEGLIDSLEPRNVLEATIVEDLAKLWWKKARAERAQAGVQIREVERMMTARLKEIHEVNRDALDVPEEEVMEKGVLSVPDCTGKFEDAYRFFEILLAHVEGRRRCESPENVLQALYGTKPTWRGSLVIQAFEDLMEAEARADDNAALDFADAEPDPDVQEAGSPEAEAAPAAVRQPRPGRGRGPTDGAQATPDEEASPLESARLIARVFLLEETRDLHSQHEVFLRQYVELSDAVRDSYLAPTDSRWTWMLRMDNFLERQIDRKIKLLMQLRRFNGWEAAPPASPAAGRRGDSSPPAGPGGLPPRGASARRGGGNGRQTPKLAKDTKMQKRSHQVVENKEQRLASFSKTNPKAGTASSPPRSVAATCRRRILQVGERSSPLQLQRCSEVGAASSPLTPSHVQTTGCASVGGLNGAGALATTGCPPRDGLPIERRRISNFDFPVSIFSVHWRIGVSPREAEGPAT